MPGEKDRGYILNTSPKEQLGRISLVNWGIQKHPCSQRKLESHASAHRNLEKTLNCHIGLIPIPLAKLLVLKEWVSTETLHKDWETSFLFSCVCTLCIWLIGFYFSLSASWCLNKWTATVANDPNCNKTKRRGKCDSQIHHIIIFKRPAVNKKSQTSKHNPFKRTKQIVSIYCSS